MKVFVVMGNDYPDAVFATERAAELYCMERYAENKHKSSQARIIYWRFYEFKVREGWA